MARQVSVAVGLACLLAAHPGAQDPLRREADGMLRKLETIDARARLPAGPRRAPLRTTFTDGEVNAYFKVYGPAFLPDGLVDPQIAIGEGGRVRATSIVDLNRIRDAQARGWLDPLAYVGGSVEVTAIGTLKTQDGRGLFSLEQATLGGVTVPKTLLQELVSYYSRSPELPAGVNLERPFDLPSRIRAVETGRGAATVVQ
jgi:hypothetical protein